MSAPLLLLKVVGKAAANFVGGGVAGDVLFDVLPEVAGHAWKWWSQERTPEQRQAELEALARTPTVDLRAQVKAVALEVAGDKPVATQEAIQIYLSLLPGQLRKSMRSPTNPDGKTVPHARVPQQADDLIPLLPPRLPRFKTGDCPLPGVDWELEELLGVGGFGEVWKAKNALLDSVPPVALKFCLDASAARMLKHEAAVLDRVMRQGRHDGIVPLQHTYLTAETPCLEYEFISGGDLAGLIQEWHRCGTRPSCEEIARIVAELAETVGFAHRLPQPIIHRDLKPANILRVGMADGSIKLKIADFGIGGVASQQAIRESTRASTRGLFLVSALRGSCTPLYASVQQMRGDEPDPRDDVFALGVIWYQMLTGDLTAGRPGGSKWQRRLAEGGMSAALIEVLGETFEDERADRIAHGQALAERLWAVVGRGAVRSPAGPLGAAAALAGTQQVPVAAATAPAQTQASVSSGIQDRPRPPEALAVALSRCEKAIAQDAGNAWAYFERAEVYRLLGEPDGALADCDQALRLQPALHQALGTRAWARSQKGDHAGALADVEQALRCNPRYGWAYATRAEVQRARGQLDAAIADCTEAIRLEPRHARVWWTRGEAYRLKGDLERASADCTEAIRLDPKLACAYSTRGWAQRAKNQPDAALADCSEAIRLDPRDARAWYNRGEAHRLKNQFDKAIADFTEAISLDPSFAPAYGARGGAYRGKDDHDRALADLDECLRLDSGYAWGWAVRGETHRLKKDLNQAIADCTEALRLDPNSSLAYATRGAAFRGKGDFATAVADLTDALKLAPGYRWAQDQLDLARRRRR
jgi:tetratricopeptide (TPR) repeat protein